MKSILLSILILFSLDVFSQGEREYRFNTQETSLFEEEYPFHYLLADEVLLRACPASTCTAVDVLSIGSKLILKERSDSSMVLNGVKSKWYKIETDGKTGWIWGGMIARTAFRSEVDSDVIFYIGPEKNIPYSRFNSEGGEFYQIRAVKNGKQLDKLVIRFPGSLYGAIKNRGNMGLKSVDDIITFHQPCTGGCGCSTGDTYVFWDEHKLHDIGYLGGTADAEYSSHQEFIFPISMDGIPGTIVKVISYPSEDPEDLLKKVLRRIYKKEFYLWDGKKLIPSWQKPIKKSYLIGSN